VFRGTATELQRVLASNIRLADRQIEILTQTLKHEEELLNRSAKIDVLLDGIDIGTRKADEAISIDLEEGADAKKLVFVLDNTGSEPLRSPVVVFRSEPATVCIEADGSTGEACNKRQTGGPMFLSLMVGVGTNYPIAVKIPPDIQSFVLGVQVSGEGMSGPVTVSQLFKVHRVKARSSAQAK
jgi:hypothetical protein